MLGHGRVGRACPAPRARAARRSRARRACRSFRLVGEPLDPVLVDDDLAGLPDQQRVPVGRRLTHRCRADRAGRAGAVLHHDGLPERGSELVGDHARDHVAGAARRVGDDQVDRAGGEGLRGGGEGEGRCRQCAYQQSNPHFASSPNRCSRSRSGAVASRGLGLCVGSIDNGCNVVIMSNMRAVVLIDERHVIAENAFVEIVVWQVPQPVRRSAHRLKYRLALVVGGRVRPSLRQRSRQGRSPALWQRRNHLTFSGATSSCSQISGRT